MKKFKIYLDTTIPSYVFNDHVPDKQIAVKKLFELFKEGKLEPYISDVVIREIQRVRDIVLRDRLVDLIRELIVLDVSEECTSLAQEYILKGIIPAEYRNDALHIAYASVYDMDFLVSYNYEHIVKIKTIDKVTGVNLFLGYRTPRIVIPEEVLDV
jgi:predicted nucleic acid-binding protein